jgi:hypothetical protein
MRHDEKLLPQMLAILESGPIDFGGIRYCPTRRWSADHSQFGRLRDSPVLGLADRWEAIPPS